MGKRRMFSSDITDTDNFLDMPLSTQALYFHLGLKADDDGFIGNPKRIQRMVGCNEDDLKLLLAKGFVIPFDSGVCVIRHWKVHNYIRSDRYKETVYIPEKSMLSVAKNGEYMLSDSIGIPSDTQAVYQESHQMDTQVKVSKGKVNKNNIKNTMYSCAEPDKPDSTPSTEPSVISLILNDKTYHHVYQREVDEWSKLYPAVDIMQELRKMKGWCDNNPTKRKTKRGIRRFINSWLSREQDKSGTYRGTTRNDWNGGSEANEAARYEAEQRAAYGKY